MHFGGLKSLVTLLGEAAEQNLGGLRLWGDIGMMDKKMQITIVYCGYIGVISG